MFVNCFFDESEGSAHSDGDYAVTDNDDSTHDDDDSTSAIAARGLRAQGKLVNHTDTITINYYYDKSCIACMATAPRVGGVGMPQWCWAWVGKILIAFGPSVSSACLCYLWAASGPLLGPGPPYLASGLANAKPRPLMPHSAAAANHKHQCLILLWPPSTLPPTSSSVTMKQHTKTTGGSSTDSSTNLPQLLFLANHNGAITTIPCQRTEGWRA
jgi:hypothetical protein